MPPARAAGAAPGVLRDVGVVLHAPAGIAAPIAAWRLAVGDLTGGLAFLGGPGNNYAMHAIAETVARVRGNVTRGLVGGLFEFQGPL